MGARTPDPSVPSGLGWLQAVRLPLARTKYWLWLRIERHVLRLRGVRVDPSARLVNVRFRGPARVEARCRLMGNPRVELGRDVVVGPDVHVQGDIVVGDRTRIGPRTCMWGRDHGIEPGTPIRSQPHRTEPIRVGADVEIGAGAVLLRGVTVGDGARVGAGAVCTRDVAPGAKVAGSPARPVGAGERASESGG